MHNETCWCDDCCTTRAENDASARETAIAQIAHTMPFPSEYTAVLRTRIAHDMAHHEYRNMCDVYGRDSKQAQQAYATFERCSREACRASYRYDDKIKTAF